MVSYEDRASPVHTRLCCWRTTKLPVENISGALQLTVDSFVYTESTSYSLLCKTDTGVGGTCEIREGYKIFCDDNDAGTETRF